MEQMEAGGGDGADGGWGWVEGGWGEAGRIYMRWRCFSPRAVPRPPGPKARTLIQ